MIENILGNLVVKIVGDNTQLIGSLSGAKSATQQVGAQIENNFSNIASGLTSMGTALTGALTVPLTALAVASVKTFAGFQTSMHEMIGLVGIAKDQVATWSNDLIKLGPELGQTPKALADAMFYITSAGLRGKDAMDALVESAKASAGGLGDITNVANAATSAMNAYGAQNLSAAQATDVLVATVREGKLQAADLAAEIGVVIPTANAMGVKFNEVGAVIASLTRIGFNTAESVTSLNQVLTAFLKPTTSAEKALAQFGLSAESVRQEIKEKGLIATLQDLQTKLGNNDAVLAEIVPNVRALRGVLGLFGDNAENTIGIMQRMTDNTGATDAAFRSASETIEFKAKAAFSSFSGTLTVLGQTIGSNLLPVLESLTKVAQSITEWWQKLDDGTKNFIVTMGLFVAAIGPATLAVGLLGKALLFFSGNPVILAIAGITAGVILLTGAIVAASNAAEANKMQKAFHDVTSSLNESVASGNDVVTAIQNVAKQTGFAVGTVADLAEKAGLVSVEMQKQVNALIEANAQTDKQKTNTSEIVDQNKTIRDLLGVAVNSGIDMNKVIQNGVAAWGVSIDRVLSIAATLDNMTAAQKEQLATLQKQNTLDSTYQQGMIGWEQQKIQLKQQYEAEQKKQLELTAQQAKADQDAADKALARIQGVEKARDAATSKYNQDQADSQALAKAGLLTQDQLLQEELQHTNDLINSLRSIGYASQKDGEIGYAILVQAFEQQKQLTQEIKNRQQAERDATGTQKDNLKELEGASWNYYNTISTYDADFRSAEQNRAKQAIQTQNAFLNDLAANWKSYVQQALTGLTQLFSGLSAMYQADAQQQINAITAKENALKTQYSAQTKEEKALADYNAQQKAKTQQDLQAKITAEEQALSTITDETAKAAAEQQLIADQTALHQQQLQDAAAESRTAANTAEAQATADLEKQKAEIQYKADLASWNANLAQAIAGAALAIIQGYAQLGPIGGSIAAVVTAIATGIQISAMESNKPVAPSLATGGIATKPTLAVIGDVKNANEAVLPLTTSVLSKIGDGIVASLAARSRPASITPATAGSPSFASSDSKQGNVSINAGVLVADSAGLQKLAQVLRPHLAKENARIGAI